MTFARNIYQALAGVAIGVLTPYAQAHEFWIDAQAASFAPGETVEANLRVGQMMKGSGMIYNPGSFTQYLDFYDGKKIEVPGRLGDRPALSLQNAGEGLHVISHMTTANRLKYAEFAKFEKFANDHGQSFAIAKHRARGLPEMAFTEAYFRCAKSLIKVGDGAGSDLDTGLPFELTALDNPYTSDGPIRFLLTYNGAPKADHQVDMFHRTAPGEIATKGSVLTNAAGEFSVPRMAGEYLLNAVVLDEPKPHIAEKLDAVWVSLWASTTFELE